MTTQCDVGVYNILAEEVDCEDPVDICNQWAYRYMAEALKEELREPSPEAETLRLAALALMEPDVLNPTTLADLLGEWL